MYTTFPPHVWHDWGGGECDCSTSHASLLHGGRHITSLGYSVLCGMSLSVYDPSSSFQNQSPGPGCVSVQEVSNIKYHPFYKRSIQRYGRSITPSYPWRLTNRIGSFCVIYLYTTVPICIGLLGRNAWESKFVSWPWPFEPIHICTYIQ